VTTPIVIDSSLCGWKIRIPELVVPRHTQRLTQSSEVALQRLLPGALWNHEPKVALHLPDDRFHSRHGTAMHPHPANQKPVGNRRESVQHTVLKVEIWEEEIPETVEDHPMPISLIPLNHMGVMADDHMNACVDQGPAEPNLLRRRVVVVLLSPVQ
jgi:hypothetical protein